MGCACRVQSGFVGLPNTNTEFYSRLRTRKTLGGKHDKTMPVKIVCQHIFCDNYILVGYGNGGQRYCSIECRKAQAQIRKTVGSKLSTVKGDTK